MDKNHRFYNSIFIQAVLVVVGFALLSLVLSGYFFRQSMKAVAMKEAENKATIFLSTMETSVRRFVMDRESKRLTELIEERAKFLESNLNFTIIRVVVRDSQGRILDHTKTEKIGQTTYATDDFLKVIASGRPLIKRQIKTLQLEPGKPEIQVIEVTFPISNRKGDIVATVKIILDVRRTFELIHEEYWRFSKRVFLGFALASVLLILGTLFFLRRRIITPVLSVAAASARVASGDLEIRLVPRGRNEIAELTKSFNQMVEGLKQRDFIRETFGRYVDRDVARELMRRPEASRLGGEKREVAVLISDIRGFTSLSKSLSPEIIISILNRYFAHLIEVIQKHKGIIVDFLGDGVLVFFDPFENPVGPVISQAVHCAIEIQERMVVFNAEIRKEGLPEFHTGIGVNAGEVVVGNIGSLTRAKYGIVGSPVNITQRIQSMAKGGNVVISESVYHYLEEDLRIKQSFRVTLKSIPEKINLYVVEGFMKM